MSGVLHPVGPEPASTYWLRRGLVVGVLAVLVALTTALVGGNDQRPQAVPAGPAASIPAPGAAAGRPSSTSSPGTLSTRMSTPPANGSGRATVPAAQAAVAPCAPAALRGTLTGKLRLDPGEQNTFRLSLINEGTKTCAVGVSAKNFELELYSGRDRIWTTRHCPASVPKISRPVPSQRAVEWQLKWNGKRSLSGCRSPSENPEPGTYLATAQLAGAEPVQLRILLS